MVMYFDLLMGILWILHDSVIALIFFWVLLFCNNFELMQ